MKLIGTAIKVVLLAALLFALSRTDRALKKDHLGDARHVSATNRV